MTRHGIGRPHSRRLATAGMVLGLAIAANAWATAGANEIIVPGTDPTTGLRMERYRAPTPDVLPGGRVVGITEVADAVATRGAVLIDVLPAKGAGPDPLDGVWRISEAHVTVPGATWLPEVGRGTLDGDMERYFRAHLDRLTGGDKARPLIFFCTADCWMSWNAARRAIRWGHRDVRWYPEGTDGWREHDRRLVAVTPPPVDWGE